MSRKIKFRIRNLEENRFENLENITITYDSIGIEIYKDNGSVLDNYELNQFAGLKDKNSTEVYEGDLISYHFNDDVLGIVKYGEYKNPCDDIHASHIGFYVDFKDERYKNTIRKDLGYWLKVSSVCGNIYENK